MTSRLARFPTVSEGMAGMLATPLSYLGAWIIITGLLLVGPVIRSSLLAEHLHFQAIAAKDGAYIAVIAPSQLPGSEADAAAGTTGVAAAVETPDVPRTPGTSHPDGAPDLSFADCERILRSPGIIGVGAVGQPIKVVPATAPSETVSLYPVSQGLLQLLSVNPDYATGRLVVGSLVAFELGLRDGSRLALRIPGAGSVNAPVTVLPEIPGRTASFDRSILAIAPPSQSASACWVQTAGIIVNTLAQWAPALLGGTAVDVTPLTAPPAAPNSGIGSAAMAEGVAVLVALTAWMLVRRLSRDEVLLNRIAGVSWSSLMLHDTIRWLTMCICGMPIAVVTCMAVDSNTAPVDVAFFAIYIRDIAAVTAAVILTRTVASLRRDWEWRALRTAP